MPFTCVQSDQDLRVLPYDTILLDAFELGVEKHIYIYNFTVQYFYSTYITVHLATFS